MDWLESARKKSAALEKLACVEQACALVEYGDPRDAVILMLPDLGTIPANIAHILRNRAEKRRLELFGW